MCLVFQICPLVRFHNRDYFDFPDSLSRLLGKWRRVLATGGDAEPQQPELEERLEEYYAATR